MKNFIERPCERAKASLILLYSKESVNSYKSVQLEQLIFIIDLTEQRAQDRRHKCISNDTDFHFALPGGWKRRRQR